jgi:hypothetical protein
MINLILLTQVVVVGNISCVFRRAENTKLETP